MVGAMFRGPGHLEVGEVETPEVGPDEILVKEGANTVCGTDVRILRGEKTCGIGRDVVPGHEVAGYVTKLGRNVRGYETGVIESGRVAAERMNHAPLPACGRREGHRGLGRRRRQNSCRDALIGGRSAQGVGRGRSSLTRNKSGEEEKIT